jgi:hypothetical protein
MLRIIFLIILMSIPAWSLSSIKGYQEWKREKVQLAQSQVSNLHAQIFKAQSEGNKKLVENLERQSTQLHWNMEVAQDLSVTDYFVLYLSQQNQPDRFQQSAAKMSTREVAELIEAYAKTLNTGPVEAISQSPQQAAVLKKLPYQAIQNK